MCEKSILFFFTTEVTENTEISFSSSSVFSVTSVVLHF